MSAAAIPQTFQLALQHHQAGRLPEAEALYREILAIQPGHAGAWHYLGVIAHQAGRHDLAVDWIRQALALDPSHAAAHSNLGEAWRAMGRLDEAIAAYRRALQLNPGFAEAHDNLGNALAEQGQIDEATAAYRRALELQPHFASAKLHLALLLLLRGNFEQGWPLFEARWAARRRAERSFSQPRWDGRPLRGRRVLIHAEQGFGDSIQFVRYARMIAGRGGGAIVECPRSLVELFRTAPDVREVAAAGGTLPPFDLHIPMLSQPLVFKTALESIPREVPYLFADPARREAWRARLGVGRARLRVGIAWAGDPQYIALRGRHIPLASLLPLCHVEGVEFFSLQVDRGTEQIQQLTGASGIIDHTAHLQDFADTAAFMAELDLIISVDTAVAHLAGALARPVWTLLPSVPDWRWGLKSDSTPWYPTMRLFRQPRFGDWDAVIREVAQELSRAAGKREWPPGVS